MWMFDCKRACIVFCYTIIPFTGMGDYPSLIWIPIPSQKKSKIRQQLSNWQSQRLNLRFIPVWEVGVVETLLLVMEEILPVEVGSFSHSLQGFTHPGQCRISSSNSIYGVKLLVIETNTDMDIWIVYTIPVFSSEHVACLTGTALPTCSISQCKRHHRLAQRKTVINVFLVSFLLGVALIIYMCLQIKTCMPSITQELQFNKSWVDLFRNQTFSSSTFSIFFGLNLRDAFNGGN